MPKQQKNPTSLFLLLGMALFFITSCASISSLPNSNNEIEQIADETQDVRDRLVNTAYSLLGANTLEVNGRHFRQDCSGVVMALYYGAGIDLTPAIQAQSGSGVERLYAALEEKGYLHTGRYPLPGDIIFWDNTYDRDGSGRPDDELTHVGMVVSVSENGDIRYIHDHVTLGIVLEYMNLRHPDQHSRTKNGRIITVNSYMRASNAPSYDKQLAGELVHALGRAYLLVD